MSTRNLTQRMVRVNAGTDAGKDIAEVATDGGSYRWAGGTGTLVTGSVVIATGLNTVTAFTANLNSSGTFATGATEVAGLRVTSITTGAVTVGGVFNAFVTGAATASVSGTSNFYWTAVGT